MKTFSRYCLLLIAVGVFMCCTDRVLALLFPYIPKFAGKVLAKAYKTLDELSRFVRNI